MKRVLLFTAVAVLGISTAAQADPFAVAYGNTVTQTMPDGTKLIMYVNADKTWEQQVGGRTMKGTYAWQDDTHVCFTLTDPAPQDASKATNCNEAIGDHKVGDTWIQTRPDGLKITVSITAGR